MRVVHRLGEVGPTSCSYVTIGVFDGLHQGHQRLISRMVESARSADCLAVAITFDPHPATVLGSEPLPLLTTVGERIDLMDELGLDVLVVYPFTSETARTSASGFVDELVENLSLAALWIGPDFTLGHQREGDIPTLRQLGEERGFTVQSVDPVMWGGETVRSSRVREALQIGDVAEAEGCLGRPYRLSGVVVHGRGLGQDIDVPTANISPPPNRLIPAAGVYACLAHTERWGTYRAAANVGTRPTFARASERGTKTVEAHLLDFDRDLYDQVLALDFIARLRDERAYSTLNALVSQLHDDIDQARAILRERV